MAIIRRRLLFWLIKAYIKKWGKFIAFSFVAGLIIFLSLIIFFTYISHLFPVKKTVGMVGAYTADTLPTQITSKLSRGLTRVEPNGQIKPDLASSWEISGNDKTYTFHLKKGIYFSNKKEFNSSHIQYSFADVDIKRPDKSTIVFTLKTKDPYAPFLVTVSKPIFPKGFSGLGEYQITDSTLNGEYISELSITNKKNKKEQITYLFYPNHEALKTAFLLGEMTEVTGINEDTFQGIPLTNSKTTTVKKSTNYNQLVTLFYNTKDKNISDNKLRKALSYALPDSFTRGERAFVPYSPKSIYFSKDLSEKKQDIAHTRLLLDAIYPDGAKIPELTIKTLVRYQDVANEVAAIWRKQGIPVKVEEVDSKPDVFEIYLGEFSIPRDPDQYALWHSNEETNITRFQNLRIDKLLEDGRKTVSISERKKIYADFQKYLNDDANGDTPASFLFFPYSYTITRTN